MAENVGSIAYDARIRTDDFNSDANKVERRAGQVADSVEKTGNKGFRGFASSASESLNTVADGLGRVLKSALIIGTSGSAGMGAMALASWNQVSAVQQATIALNAYEKDGDKVNKVLSELVGYARSDMGVLFNRKDLFSAAQGLKLMGDNTDQLTEHVKIMSRSVGLGLSTWDDLTRIIGRVGSTGRLAGEDFENLTKAGYKLDSSLRNTDMTFEQLFQHLDKGIPADAMAGQATTIVGLGVRMQTAFRNLGDAILGVDADSGKFVTGGLGDKLVGLMGTLTKLMKDPALKEGFRKLGQGIGTFAEKALPILIEGFSWVVNNIGTVTAGIGALAAAFVAAKVAAIGFAIAAGVNPMNVIIAAITAVVAAVVFLQLKFDIFGKAAKGIVKAWETVGRFFKDLWADINDIFDGIGKWFTDRFNDAKDGIIKAFNSVKKTFKDVMDAIRGYVEDHKQAIINWSIIIGTILLPKIVQIGITALVSAAQTVAAFATMSAAAIAHAAITTAAWIVSAAKTLYAWVTVTLPRIIAQFAIMSFHAVVNAAIITGAFVLSSVQTLASWGLTFAGYLLGLTVLVVQTGIAAVRLAASWLLAMGPLGAIAAAIIGLTGLIIANWETVKGWFASFWPWLKNTASSAVDSIKRIFKGISTFFDDAKDWLWDAGKNLIQGFINGIKSKFNDVKSTLGDLTNKLTSWKGPASLDKVILKQSGQLVIGGFINGLESMYGSVHRSLGGLTNSIGAPAVSSPTASMGGLDAIDSARSSGSSNSSVSINVNMSGIMARSKSDERDIAKSLVRRINEELSAKGQPVIAGGVV